jgi:hypothetical protein
MKRLATSVLALLGLGLLATTSIAQAASGPARVETSQVTFVLSSSTCSRLPAGSTIRGSGMQRSVTTERVDARGITTIVNSTNAQGTATDQAGNRYAFHYTNQFRLENTVANQDVYSGLMSDFFVLSGDGPAKLHNGFVARLTTDIDFSSVIWSVLVAFGDPISFASGPVVNRCDPI